MIFFRIIRGLIKILLYSKKGILKYYSKVPKEITLRILGNGNSLNQTMLDKSHHIKYLVVNRHILADNYTIIKPDYYVLADPHFFSHPEGLSIIQKINELTTWEMELFVPYAGNNIKKIESYITNKNIHIIPYNSNTYAERFPFSAYLYEHQLAMPQVQNVIVAAIMIGIVKKFQRIELYGVEHNWLSNLYVGEDNLVYLRNNHFYDKIPVKPKPQKEIQNMDEYPLHKNIYDYARMFESYWEIKRYIENNLSTIKVINRTEGSFIDAFDRN